MCIRWDSRIRKWIVKAEGRAEVWQFKDHNEALKFATHENFWALLNKGGHFAAVNRKGQVLDLKGDYIAALHAVRAKQSHHEQLVDGREWRKAHETEMDD